MQEILEERIGRRLRNSIMTDKKFGEGIVIGTKGDFIIVNFETVGRKQLNLQLCLEKKLIEYVDKS